MKALWLLYLYTHRGRNYRGSRFRNYHWGLFNRNHVPQ